MNVPKLDFSLQSDQKVGINKKFIAFLKRNETFFVNK